MARMPIATVSTIVRAEAHPDVSEVERRGAVEQLFDRVEVARVLHEAIEGVFARGKCTAIVALVRVTASGAAACIEVVESLGEGLAVGDLLGRHTGSVDRR